jgi:hypothetical protein
MPRYHNINGNKVQFTAEEETARDAEEKAWADGAVGRAQANLRTKRNRLLQESDWEITSELEKGNAISSDMKKYRQDLRDLPAGKDTVAKCENATWPTKP